MKQQFKNAIFLLLIMFLVTFAAMPSSQAAPNDSTILRERVTEWADAWSSGDEVFSMDRVKDVYDNSDRFLEFDTLSPGESTIAQGYKQFQAVWEPVMADSTHAVTRLNDDLQISTDGKMGLTAFTFHTEAQDRNTNEEFASDAHATMVWGKQNGKWVIVHEHVSAPLRS